MKIKITVKDLQKINACQSAIDEFVRMFGQIYSDDWTRDKQIEILKSPLGKYIGWAYFHGLIPLWSLSFTDLSSADLRSANLSSANLSFADLRFTNLSSADLRSANLSFADLRFTNLRSANLSSADLSSADLSSANLRFTNLSFADLRFTNLSSANIDRDPEIDGWKFENGQLWRDK